MNKYRVEVEWSGYSRGTATYIVESDSKQSAEEGMYFNEDLVRRNIVRDDTDEKAMLLPYTLQCSSSHHQKSVSNKSKSSSLRNDEANFTGTNIYSSCNSKLGNAHNKLPNNPDNIHL